MNSKRSTGSGFFEGLITSKTRIRILMRLFANPDGKAYLRELSHEFNVSPSLIKEELHQLHGAGLLESQRDGRQIDYRANTKHVLFPELHSMVRKALGMDQIVESIISRLGNLEKAFLICDYAEGKDTGLIDLVLVGNVNERNLRDLVKKTERYIDRKIRTLVLGNDERSLLEKVLATRPHLLLWEQQSVAGTAST